MLKRKNRGKGIRRKIIARPRVRINKRKQQPIKVVFLCIYGTTSMIFAQKFITFLSTTRPELVGKIKVDSTGIERSDLGNKLKGAAVIVSQFTSRRDKRFAEKRLKKLSNGAHIMGLPVSEGKGIEFNEILRRAGVGKK
jgi:hypothetical protein